MYGTPSRFSTTFRRPCCTRLLILSFNSSSPSPSVIFPFRSSTVTSPADRSSICMVEDIRLEGQTAGPALRCYWRGTLRSEAPTARHRAIPFAEAPPGERRPPPRRTERHGRFLAARGARGLRLNPVTHRGARVHAVCPFGLARLAALRLVLELLVGEEELFTGRPDEL